MAAIVEGGRMTDAERKAVGYLIRSAVDLAAATMGNKPIYPNRRHLREVVAQSVEEKMPLFDVPGYLAEVLVAANAPQPGGQG
jgi:hypothetical protein